MAAGAGWMLAAAGLAVYTIAWDGEAGMALALAMFSVLAYIVCATGIELRETKHLGELALEPEDRLSNWPRAIAKSLLTVVLTVESRGEATLVDLSFFARRKFTMGVAIGSLSMFSIMSLLLYFNLYAQSREGLGLTALEAGASLLPLSASLLALALSASAVAARVGLRNAMTGGMALIAIASAIIGVAITAHSMVLLAIGLLVMGFGLAVPYALAPRLALSVLSPAQAGQGSGVVNACTFLGGSVGVAGGATAFALGGFVAVLMMIALAGIVGAALSRGILETP
jgi:hypothetical protein